MATTLEDLQNSFVRFYDQEFLTDDGCGIVVDTCLPICEAADLRMQFLVSTTDFDDATELSNGLTIFRATESGNTTITGVTKSVTLLSGDTYLIRLNFNGSSLISGLNDSDCFNLRLSFQADEPPPFLAITSQTCFKYSEDKCFTSRITYGNNEDAFGFYYPSNTTFNAIRLPIYGMNPNINIDQEVYVRSNGVRTKTFARLAKKYKFITDYLPEEIHQKLVVALNHDSVLIATSNDYQLECTFESEYNQDFPKIMQGMNVWTANFEVFETPFNEVNNNCG